MARLLYHTPLSPFCRLARAALHEKELEFTLTEENIWEQRMEFFALNPAGEVPVLLEENGTVVSGIYALSEYLEEAYESRPLLGKDAMERAEVRRLIDWFNNKFDQEVTQLVLFEKIFKQLSPEGRARGTNSEAIRMGKRNILYHLDYIGYLTESRCWLAGEELTMADLAAAAHLSSLDYLGDVPWNHNAAAKEWYALVKSRPSFRAILADRVRGRVPPPYYDNPDF